MDFHFWPEIHISTPLNCYKSPGTVLGCWIHEKIHMGLMDFPIISLIFQIFRADPIITSGSKFLRMYIMVKLMDRKEKKQGSPRLFCHDRANNGKFSNFSLQSFHFRSILVSTNCPCLCKPSTRSTGSRTGRNAVLLVLRHRSMRKPKTEEHRSGIMCWSTCTCLDRLERRWNLGNGKPQCTRSVISHGRRRGCKPRWRKLERTSLKVEVLLECTNSEFAWFTAWARRHFVFCMFYS